MKVLATGVSYRKVPASAEKKAAEYAEIHYVEMKEPKVRDGQTKQFTGLMVATVRSEWDAAMTLENALKGVGPLVVDLDTRIQTFRGKNGQEQSVTVTSVEAHGPISDYRMMSTGIVSADIGRQAAPAKSPAAAPVRAGATAVLVLIASLAISMFGGSTTVIAALPMGTPSSFSLTFPGAGSGYDQERVLEWNDIGGTWFFSAPPLSGSVEPDGLGAYFGAVYVDNGAGAEPDGMYFDFSFPGGTPTPGTSNGFGENFAGASVSFIPDPGGSAFFLSCLTVCARRR